MEGLTREAVDDYIRTFTGGLLQPELLPPAPTITAQPPHDDKLLSPPLMPPPPPAPTGPAPAQMTTVTPPLPPPPTPLQGEEDS